MDTKNGNAKLCGFCGKLIVGQRSTRRFCGNSCRVANYRRAEKQRRVRECARRAGMFLDFDGRTSGRPRDSFGTKPSVPKRLRRDTFAQPREKDKHGETEVAK
jgi:hypothetical protein